MKTWKCPKCKKNMTIEPGHDTYLGIDTVHVHCDNCGFDTMYIESTGDVQVLYSAAHKAVEKAAGVVEDVITIKGIYHKYLGKE